MIRKILCAAAAAAVLLLSAPRAHAWGAYHVGYTHVGPYGVQHYGRTVGVGPYGAFSTGRVGAYGYGGDSYHVGYGVGGYYGGAYRYGGYDRTATYGNYTTNYYRGW